MRYDRVCHLSLLTILLIAAIFISFSYLSKGKHYVNIYIYDTRDSLAMENIMKRFGNNTRINITICYLDDSSCRNEFLKIVSILIMEGRINVSSLYICITCELYHRINWYDIYTHYFSPLTLVFKNNRLKAIIISEYNQSIFPEILNEQNDITIIFIRDKKFIELNERARVQIENLFKNKGKT